MSVKEKMQEVRRSVNKRKGKCVICGNRVHGSEDYVESTDGYCHKECLIAKKATPAAQA